MPPNAEKGQSRNRKKSQPENHSPTSQSSRGKKVRKSECRNTDIAAEGKKNLRELSHSMSWVLRHKAVELGLKMTPDGYVPLEDLLACSHPRFDGRWNEKDVLECVETCKKQRFKLSHLPSEKVTCIGREDIKSSQKSNANSKEEIILCIRANQGHSIPNIIDPEQLLTRILPEELKQIETIVHGTKRKPWETYIMKEGLSKMTRHHIHFASGMPKDTHVISGMRQSCEIFIFVDSNKCADDGIEFYQSDNGVLLTAGIDNNGILPTKYFSHVMDITGEVLLDNRVSPRKN